MHYCGLAIERSEGLMSCTRSYGKSIVGIADTHNILQEDLKYPRLTKIQIPVFHSTIPFHCSIPLIPDSPYSLDWTTGLNLPTKSRFLPSSSKAVAIIGASGHLSCSYTVQSVYSGHPLAPNQFAGAICRGELER